MILGASYPPVEFIIFAVAMLLALIGKVVDFSKKLRQDSIAGTKREERRFGDDLGEAAEPPPAAPEKPPVRLDLPLRIRRPRRTEAPPAPSLPPIVRARHLHLVEPPQHVEHPIVRVLRSRRGVRGAVVLAEILGPPKALRHRGSFRVT